MAEPAGYKAILERVEAAAARCGRPGQVKLLAVSKAQTPARLRSVAAQGCTLFAENYVQEFLSHREVLPQVSWHFIGHLQTNKVRQLVPHVQLIHSVDRLRLLEELERRAAAAGIVQALLLEVNLGDEASKSGVSVGALPALAEAALGFPHLKLQGLMTIPPVDDVPEASRVYFAQLRQLRDDLVSRLGVGLPELSMGMSGDFEVAIEEGATLVRVGTAIFGPRTAQV